MRCALQCVQQLHAQGLGPIAQQFIGHLLLHGLQLCHQLLACGAQVQVAYPFVCRAGGAREPALRLQTGEDACHLGLVGVAALDHIFLRDARVASGVQQHARFVQGELRVGGLQMAARSGAEHVQQLMQVFKYLERG